jgi:thiol:disulfide interchange protein DsbC
MTKRKTAIITIILLLAAASGLIIFTPIENPFLTGFTVAPVTAKPNGSIDSQLGCGAKNCMECHSISKQDVAGILTKLDAGHVKVLDIQMSPVRGLWEVSIDDKGQRGVLYIDFSKKYIVSGSIIDVGQRIDVTQKRQDALQRDRRVDVSKIPLHDAIIMGNPNAAKKVIMFTDPG